MKKTLAILLAAVMLAVLFSGCAQTEEETASVQSVAMICGLGPTGIAQRFSGVVSARSETEVKKDENRSIGEMLVKEGDLVSAGQVLFNYDMEEAELTLEKAKLELEKMKASIESKQKEIAKLEEQQKKASADNQLSYTIEIQECETTIRETTYNITQKEKEIVRLENSLTNLDVLSPVDGKIRELNEEGGYDNYGNPKSFMTIMETGTYRVKGYVNENNISALMEGTPVLVRSRMDETLTWSGYVAMIDWENPAQSGNNYYYYDEKTDDTTSSSKYPFYIELDDAEGLLLGQHVFIEPDLGQEEEKSDAIMLPEYFLNDADTGAWVWAQGSNGKLEKRSVTLGIHDEELGVWEITSGLTAADYIAFPEESLHAGMPCSTYDESAFNVNPDFDFGEPMMPMENGIYPEDGEYYGEEFYGEEFYGEEFYGEDGDMGIDVADLGEGDQADGNGWMPAEGGEAIPEPYEGETDGNDSGETSEGSAPEETVGVG